MNTNMPRGEMSNDGNSPQGDPNCQPIEPMATTPERPEEPQRAHTVDALGQLAASNMTHSPEAPTSQDELFGAAIIEAIRVRGSYDYGERTAIGADAHRFQIEIPNVGTSGEDGVVIISDYKASWHKAFNKYETIDPETGEVTRCDFQRGQRELLEAGHTIVSFGVTVDGVPDEVSYLAFRPSDLDLNNGIVELTIDPVIPRDLADNTKYANPDMPIILRLGKGDLEYTVADPATDPILSGILTSLKNPEQV